MAVRDRIGEVKVRAGDAGSGEEEVRVIRRNALKDARAPRTPLGSRVRARFAGIGLESELAELRGGLAQPAAFEP